MLSLAFLCAACRDEGKSLCDCNNHPPFPQDCRMANDAQMRLAERTKSILDGMKIDNKALPSSPDYSGPESPAKIVSTEVVETLNIVSHCPTCGAPIFGPTCIRSNRVPNVKMSCTCHQNKGSLEMRTT